MQRLASSMGFRDNGAIGAEEEPAKGKSRKLKAEMGPGGHAEMLTS